MSEVNNFLPKWFYEVLRWVTVAALPTIGAVIAGLDGYWNWGLPIAAITGTLDLIGMALGALFLGSKIATDRANK